MSAGRRGLAAWALYDWANNGFSTVVLTFVFAPYFTERVAGDTAAGSNLWGNMLAASNLLAALSGPVLGAAADRMGRRKPWIGAFTGLCAAATAGLWLAKPEPVWIWPALALMFTAASASQLAMIFYNAMLPDLAPAGRVGRWSGWGWGLGYAGGLACLGLSWLLFLGDDSLVGLQGASAVRAVVVLAALWYALFSLPLLVFSPERPGGGEPLGRAARRGLGQLRESLGRLRRRPGLLRFLAARMLYNDGLVTLFAFGGVYAAGTFGLNEGETLLFGVLLSATAGAGALGFSWIDDAVGPRRTILAALGCMMAIGAVLVLTRSTAVFWVFSAVLGLFVGPVQASSRSWLAQAAPAEMRGELFGLYALSGKLTAFAGPLA
ncbi:MAG: MFS transporter, partial [Desulfovibrionaceae bacterium]